MKKHMMKLAALSILFLTASFVHAEKIQFTANQMSGVAGNKNSMTSLKGNAKVTTKNMIINADYIELSGKDFRMIKAVGNITGKNTESNLDFTCGKLLYDRDTKIATLENDVKLVDTDNDVVAKAQIIEYDQNSEIAVMQIKINLTQKDNVCTSAYAIYRKTEQILEMNGNPKIVQKGDTFRAQSITLDMNSQEITLSGRVKGSVVTKKGGDDNGDSENDLDQTADEAKETDETKDSDRADESDATDESKMDGSDEVTSGSSGAVEEKAGSSEKKQADTSKKEIEETKEEKVPEVSSGEIANRSSKKNSKKKGGKK